MDELGVWWIIVWGVEVVEVVVMGFGGGVLGFEIGG